METKSRYWEPFLEMYIEKPKGYDNRPFIDIPKIIRIPLPRIKRFRRNAPRIPLRDIPPIHPRGSIEFKKTA